MSHFVPKLIITVSKKAKKIYEKIGYNKSYLNIFQMDMIYQL